MRKNCSSDREKLLKFEAEGREFAKCLRSLEQFIQTVKGQNTFWQHNDFLTCSWRFIRSKTLEQFFSFPFSYPNIYIMIFQSIYLSIFQFLNF